MKKRQEFEHETGDKQAEEINVFDSFLSKMFENLPTSNVAVMTHAVMVWVNFVVDKLCWNSL
jgi:hypothetical protein